MVTQKEVADVAGVSPRTVSNVVNNQPHVTPEVQAKVMAAINKLGYKQNMVAKSLRTSKIGLLGLIVPDLSQSLFAQLASAVVKEATNMGYTVAVDQTLNDIERERRLIQIGPHGALFDGAIFHPKFLSEEEITHRTNNFPLVLVGERLDVDNMDRVYTDDKAAAFDAVSQLILDGGTRIAAIGLRHDSYAHTTHLREQGLRNALAAHHIPAKTEYLRYVNEYDENNGYTAMAALLKVTVLPDAVFCFSDMLALGAMRKLNEQHIRIPDQISIIGFDNVNEDAWTSPSLSSISADTEETAKEAVAALIRRISTPNSPYREHTISHYAVLRESTKNRYNLPGTVLYHRG